MGNCNTFGTQSKMGQCRTNGLDQTCSGQVARWAFVRQNAFKPLKMDPSSNEKKWSISTTFLLANLPTYITIPIDYLQKESICYH